MSQSDLSQRVKQVKVVLEELEREVTGEGVPREVLEDFKMAVDHIRLSTWTILTATRTTGYRTIVAQFRLNRVAEMCRHVRFDIQSGLIGSDFHDLERVHASLEETLQHVAGLIKSGEREL
ncbi:MAG: hypothetical protein GTN62_12060 [Gemmatimonadales bacterium]|nr:hypothetical protein [Gemmatimonadales bacterium]NIN12454.1 hypothetical protein [Gemmatimonadales bacterium]NIN50830.1 hypothetical protein [Gemmatimonadales bacterium]NIP08294.1 hypothetical protein [Gemmatimonadales bacterium]NIR00818.1 hypothetical protein [Gemmatimonadales bacterium]